jgi:hypothetical protein
MSATFDNRRVRPLSSRGMSAVNRVRERRMAAALARHYRDEEGLSIAEIARRLGRAEATVKAYLYDPSDANKRPMQTSARRVPCTAPAGAQKLSRASAGQNARRHHWPCLSPRLVMLSAQARSGNSPPPRCRAGESPRRSSAGDLGVGRICRENADAAPSERPGRVLMGGDVITDRPRRHVLPIEPERIEQVQHGLALSHSRLGWIS